MFNKTVASNPTGLKFCLSDKATLNSIGEKAQSHPVRGNCTGVTSGFERVERAPEEGEGTQWRCGETGRGQEGLWAQVKEFGPGGPWKEVGWCLYQLCAPKTVTASSGQGLETKPR